MSFIQKLFHIFRWHLMCFFGGHNSPYPQNLKFLSLNCIQELYLQIIMIDIQQQQQHNIIV